MVGGVEDYFGWDLDIGRFELYTRIIKTTKRNMYNRPTYAPVTPDVIQVVGQ
jgi:hypothetical protein